MSRSIKAALFSPGISSVIERSGWKACCLSAALLMVILYLPAILFLLSPDPKTKETIPPGRAEAVKREAVTKQDDRNAGLGTRLFLWPRLPSRS